MAEPAGSDGVREKAFGEELLARYRAARAEYEEAAQKTENVEREWRELKQRLVSLEEKLGQSRRALQERRSYLMALATVLKEEGLLSPEELERETETTQFGGAGGRKEESMTDVARRVLLRYYPRGLHYRDLERILREEENCAVPGQDPAATLLTRLSRDDRFERVGRGIYRVRASVEEGNYSPNTAVDKSKSVTVPAP